MFPDPVVIKCTLKDSTRRSKYEISDSGAGLLVGAVYFLAVVCHAEVTLTKKKQQHRSSGEVGASSGLPECNAATMKLTLVLA